MSPAWSLEAGSGGATPPAPPPTGPPLHGLIFWVKGDAGLTSVAGEAVSWADQSGLGQDVGADLPFNPGPFTGLDTLDGIPGTTGTIIHNVNRGLYRAAPNGLRDTNGNPMGYGPGETQPRTIMSIIRPLYGTYAIDRHITGGIVMEMGSIPNFQPTFALDDGYTGGPTPDAFLVWMNGALGPSGVVRGPDTPNGPGNIYDNVPLMVEWSSTGFDNLSVRINNSAPIALTPPNMTGSTAPSTTTFAILRAISGGNNLLGASFEHLIWDYSLTTDPAAHAQAVAYLAGRYPSIPIVGS